MNYNIIIEVNQHTTYYVQKHPIFFRMRGLIAHLIAVMQTQKSPPISRWGSVLYSQQLLAFFDSSLLCYSQSTPIKWINISVNPRHSLCSPCSTWRLRRYSNGNFRSGWSAKDSSWCHHCLQYRRHSLNERRW